MDKYRCFGYGFLAMGVVSFMLTVRMFACLLYLCLSKCVRTVYPYAYRHIRMYVCKVAIMRMNSSLRYHMSTEYILSSTHTYITQNIHTVRSFLRGIYTLMTWTNTYNMHNTSFSHTMYIRFTTKHFMCTTYAYIRIHTHTKTASCVSDRSALYSSSAPEYARSAFVDRKAMK